MDTFGVPRVRHTTAMLAVSNKPNEDKKTAAFFPAPDRWGKKVKKHGKLNSERCAKSFFRMNKHSWNEKIRDETE